MDAGIIDDLNKQFYEYKSVSFRLTDNKFTIVEINNYAARAEISLYGAHVMTYTPQGEEPVLWLSKAAEIVDGQSIRGGIPVCWPWFGVHPDDPTMPLHGFVRNFPWHLELVLEPDRNNTELIFSLTDKDIKNDVLSQPFKLELKVCVGIELFVELKIINTGTKKLEYTAGLHSYFNIADISNVRIKGVDGYDCFNKESGRKEKQVGDLRFEGLTTRIFHRIKNALIHDPGLNRQVDVGVDGGDSIVVWNPGQGVEQRFSGFATGDEQTMVCVEAANPVGGEIELEPGEDHCLSTRIKCEIFQLERE